MIHQLNPIVSLDIIITGFHIIIDIIHIGITNVPLTLEVETLQRSLVNYYF